MGTCQAAPDKHGHEEEYGARRVLGGTALRKMSDVVKIKPKLRIPLTSNAFSGKAAASSVSSASTATCDSSNAPTAPA